MRELTARTLADLAWADQDRFLRGARHVLHREAEFTLIGTLPPAGTLLAARTAVESAELEAGAITLLTVLTHLVDRSGTVVAVSRSSAVLDTSPWRAALAVV